VWIGSGSSSFTLLINDFCRVFRSSQYVTMYTRMIFSFMLRMKSLTYRFAWNMSILILTRCIVGQLTMVSFLKNKNTGYDYMQVSASAAFSCADLMVTWWYILKVRNLGMLVDNRVSFQDQANDILRRVKRLWHYADIKSVLTRKRLVQSLIVPYFLYCDVIYSHTSAGVNRQLNVAFNSCARILSDFERLA
jgi:uncharacterized membrane protein